MRPVGVDVALTVAMLRELVPVANCAERVRIEIFLGRRIVTFQFNAPWCHKPPVTGTIGQRATAAASIGRDYTDRFLRHGIAFAGGRNNCSTINASVKIGDKIILKRGLSQIVAVRRVVERKGRFKGDGYKDWQLDFDG